jgi:hypothetical protein
VASAEADEDIPEWFQRLFEESGPFEHPVVLILDEIDVILGAASQEARLSFLCRLRAIRHMPSSKFQVRANRGGGKM